MDTVENGRPGALTGITVLDLGQAFMGPYCGLLLQRLGADVVKVEPLQGEPYRRPTALTGKEPRQFGMLNAGKRNISIDLKHPDGRQLFFDLANTADVVIQNFAPGTFDRLIGVDALLDANPRLIVASGSGYGSTGPYKSLLAMDLTIQAMSGIMATTGFPDGSPVRTGPSVVDFMGGSHLTSAVLAALVQRGVTGRGQHVEVALYDAMLPSLASNIAGFLDTDGAIPERTGNRHGGLAVSPYNAYETADGWVALLCLHDRHWSALCGVMGRPELVDDPRFSSHTARVQAMDQVDEVVGAWAAVTATADVASALNDANVPCAPVKSLAEVVSDPQVAARGMLEFHSGSERDDWCEMGSPLRLSDSPAPDENVVAKIGEHTDELLVDWLSLDAEQINALEAEGVIKRDRASAAKLAKADLRTSLAFADTADV